MASTAATSSLPTTLLRGTDMQCGIVGFGCASLGGVYGDVDLETCREAVTESIALGVNFFDTSPYYGNSEEMLGKCLAGVARDTFYIATKCGRYGDGTHDGDIDFSAARIRASVLNSCELIGVECLDLVQCHDIEFADLDQIITETLPALDELRREGKLRYIGVSSYCLEKLICAVERSPIIDTVQTYCRLCLVDNTLMDLAPYFQRRNIGVINGSPLGMGLLTGRPPQDWHGAPDVLKQKCIEMARATEAVGVKLPVVAIAYATSMPDVANITLMGTSKASRMRSNIAAVTSPPEAYEAALRAIQDITGAKDIRRLTTVAVNGHGHNCVYSANIDQVVVTSMPLPASPRPSFYCGKT